MFVNERDYAQVLSEDARVYNSPPSQPNGIPPDFHSQMLWGILFQALVFQAEDSSVGLGPFTPWSQDIPLDSYLCSPDILLDF